MTTTEPEVAPDLEASIKVLMEAADNWTNHLEGDEDRDDDSEIDPINAAYAVVKAAVEGRHGRCWRCHTEVYEEIGIVTLSFLQGDDCPESDEPGMPHEIDEPE